MKIRIRINHRFILPDQESLALFFLFFFFFLSQLNWKLAANWETKLLIKKKKKLHLKLSLSGSNYFELALGWENCWGQEPLAKGGKNQQDCEFIIA